MSHRPKTFYGYFEDDAYEEAPLLFYRWAVFLVVMVTIRQLFALCKITYSYKISAMFLGMVYGILSVFINENFFEMNALQPRLVFHLFIPIVYLKITTALDPILFSKCIPEILLLSTLGVAIYAAFFGLVIATITGHNVRVTDMLFMIFYGITMASNDDPDLTHALKEFEDLKFALVILEGEYLLATCTVMTTLHIMFGILDGIITHWYQVLALLVRFILGAIIFGSAAGSVMNYFVRRHVCFNYLYTTAVCVLTVYLVYYISEFVLYFSAPLATFMAAYFLAGDKAKMSQSVANDFRNSICILFYLAQYLVYMEVLSNGIAIALKNMRFQGSFQYFAVYFIGLFSRIIELIILWPILRRRLKLKSFMATFWLTRKGCVQFTLVLIAYKNDVTHEIIKDCIANTMCYIFINNCVNSGFAKKALSTLGLTTPTKEKISNMNNCVKFIEAKQAAFLVYLRSNRFLTDANWSELQKTAFVTNPYKTRMQDNDDSTLILWNTKESFCADCRRDVFIEPTKREIKYMMIEAKIRILKAQRVSFVKQYEKGLTTKDALRILLQYLDISSENDDCMINIDDIVAAFQKKDALTKFKEFLEAVNQDDIFSHLLPPRRPNRRICYKIVRHKSYEIFIYLSILLCLFQFYYQDEDRKLYVVIMGILNIIFLTDFLMKVASCSHIYIKSGLKIYFRSDWNKFDFFLLCLLTVQMVYYIVVEQVFERPSTLDNKIQICSLEQFQNFRVLKLVVIIHQMIDKFLLFCERQITRRLSLSYDIAQSLILCYEEILHMLPQIIENTFIQRSIQSDILKNKELILHQFCIANENMSWISVTVKTKQLIRTSITNMRESIEMLYLSGYTDDSEYQKLLESIEACAKSSIHSQRIIRANTAEKLFLEVSWIPNEDIAKRLYKKAKLLNWNAGEVLIKEFSSAGAVYVITQGLAIQTYKSESMTMRHLYGDGMLPIKDYISHSNFEMESTECLMPGNTIGLLCAISARLYDSEITCKLPLKAFFLPLQDLFDEMELSPVLYGTIWKFICIDLVATLLWNTNIYKGYAVEEIYMALEKSFVPNLHTLGMKFFTVSEFVEDIVLVEGIARDVHSLMRYVAPCYIPRLVSKLYFEDNDVQAVIIIIPIKRQMEEKIMTLAKQLTDLPTQFAPKLSTKAAKRSSAHHRSYYVTKKES